ncbi:MAG TPA: DUF4398 domain-containing protein [Candidatus Binatia bacterium]|nr:DUF4398 domain-containing protein [Candidatus Binatia bacterium]
MSKRAFSLLATAALAVVATGCAGRKPVATVARAEMAVDHAEDAQAAVYAPVELQVAQDKLASARWAMDRNDNDEARRLANEALVHAQLAEARADSESARIAAAETRRSIEALQQRTVVIQKEQPSKVVVERSNAPDLVIEREPRPAQVVIHGQPATTVIEQPATAVVPPPTTTTTVVEKRVIPPPRTTTTTTTTTAVAVPPDPDVIIESR